MTTGESAPRARSAGLLSTGTWTVQRVRDERIELPRGATGPQAARRAVEQELGPVLDAEQSATAQLLVTELVSNAVRHGDGEAAGIVLHLAVAPDRVRIEVCDRGGGFEPQQPAPYGE